jgi:predicted permease
MRAFPPKLLRRIVRASLPAEDRRALCDELDALYAQRVAAQGRVAANRWFARQALGFVRHSGMGYWARELLNPSAFATDLRLAARGVHRRPLFAVTFALTLAMATGVVAVVSTAANWVLLRPVPGVSNPDRLVTLRLGAREGPAQVAFNVSHLDVVTLRERLPNLAGLAATSPIDVDLRAGEGSSPRRVVGEMVTSNYFTLLGARLAAGRSFLPEDDVPGVALSAVISMRLARSIGADPASLSGTMVRINGHPVQVIGVTERNFHGADLPSRAELWLSLAALGVVNPFAPRQAATDRSVGVWQKITLRLDRPATSTQVTNVTAAANGVMEAVRAEFSGSGHSYLALIYQYQAFPGVGLDPSVRGSVRKTVGLLSGAAMILLLLAIANLTNLTLTQTSTRESATAIRYALGASQLHMVRASLAETLLLGAAGGSLALFVAWMLARWFGGAQLSEFGASIEGMRIEPSVAAFTFAVALVASALAAVAPLRLARVGAIDSMLRRSSAGQVSGHRARLMFASVQVALSLMLLVTAGLLGRTVANLRAIDLGFSIDRALTFSLDPAGHGLDRARRGVVVANLEQRLAAIPGVQSAALVSPTPFGSSYITAAVYSPDAPPDARATIGAGFYVSPAFLSTLGARVISGDRQWRADSGTVVLSRGALEKILPGVTPERAIGMIVSTRPRGERPVRIAAVIENIQLSDITREPPPVIIQPLVAAPPVFSLSGFVRTSGSPMSALGAVRAAVADAAPDFSLFDARSARSAVDLQFSERRVLALAAALLGTIGLLLAAVGLYGVVANVVAARYRDIGIRSALGAGPLRVATHVLQLGLVPAAVGIVAGGSVTFAGSKVVRAYLYVVPEHDIGTYVTAILVLMAAVVLACAPPAIRAARISPAQVLRGE